MTPRLPRSLVFRRGWVLETYPGLGLGNYLYFALRAYTERSSGGSAWVLNSGLDDRWRTALPHLYPLLVRPSGAIGRQRQHIPPGFCQGFGSDFTREQLERFIAEVILPSRRNGTAPSDIVVNVRRGDYYSDPNFARLYGFDVVKYVRYAVTDAARRSRVNSLAVVSDDVEWCRRELAWLSDYAGSVTFGAQRPGPDGDFWEVAEGRRLIITNSTFSYWAAYVSQYLLGQAHGGVWAPSLHQRDVRGGAPWQHDPRWITVTVG